jgi:feruloyl esterase
MLHLKFCIVNRTNSSPYRKLGRPRSRGARGKRLLFGLSAPTGRVNFLTAVQVEAAQKIYGGPRNPRTGERIFPGLEPGSELEWNSFFAERREPFVASHLKYWVCDDPSWDFRTFNFDRDVARADQRGEKILNATNPNLKEFAAQWRQLILYHGWSDPGLASLSTVNYYQDSVAAFGT